MSDNGVQNLADGILAGAAGSAILNATTYVDMAVRGRAPSDLPQKMVAKFAQMAGASDLAKPQAALSDHERHRRIALGALLGYTDGLGAGALFGAVRPAMRGVSWFWAGIGLAALTMALSEGTATALRQTDPAQWGVSGWISDIVPRCLYGWVTAIVFDRINAR